MIKKKILSVAVASSIMLLLVGCDATKDNKGKSVNERIDIETETDAAESTEEPEDMWEDEAVSDKIDEINRYIDHYYYFGVDKDTQEEALYDGIMKGLDDPYSVYYTADEFADLQEDTSGEYVGVGAVVTQDADMVISIVRPIPGSPAEEAGLMAGDIVVEVDGTEVTGMELSLAVDMIRGVEGTSAHLKIYREGEPDYLEFDVTRRVVENVNVYSHMMEDEIGYIQVQQFYDNTTKEFEDAFEGLQSEGAKGVVVDLRDNPGGLLKSVTEMCNYLMDSGTIVTIKDKDGNVTSQYEADSEHSVDMPMVVLINGNSASASEIFAGCMQDNGLARLVGTTSFGKGIVQSVIPLSDGTAIKLTVAKYFTPNGNDIHKVGIEPDYVVELPDGRKNAVNIEYEDDLQLQKACDVLLQTIN